MSDLEKKSNNIIIDCDIHPTLQSQPDLLHYMRPSFRSQYEEVGLMRHGPLINGKRWPGGNLRMDASTPDGGLPGSDPDYLVKDHIERFGIGIGVLNPIFHEQCNRNRDMALAYCEAGNDWLCDKWLSKDSRFRGTITVPTGNIEGSVQEIKRFADNPDMIQIGFPGRPGSLLGDRLYWPIYKAAVEADLPIAVHPQLGDAMLPMTSGGWPSFYMESMADFSQVYQVHYASLVVNGVFDEFPSLRMIFIEGGFGWLPATIWRLQNVLGKCKAELPDRGDKINYGRENIWISSQPMEEYKKSEELKTVIEWIGWDRFVFASDYPHWDNDDMNYIFPFKLDEQQRNSFYGKNQQAIYAGRL